MKVAGTKARDEKKQKKILTFFQKDLDKCFPMWYNIKVVG